MIYGTKEMIEMAEMKKMKEILSFIFHLPDTFPWQVGPRGGGSGGRGSGVGGLGIFDLRAKGRISDICNISFGKVRDRRGHNHQSWQGARADGASRKHGWRG